MQIEDFVKVYQSKSDEELVQLAVAREQLTTEALLALQSELSRRAISIRRSPEVSPPDTNAHEVRALAPGKRLRMGDGHDEGVGNFVSEVLRTYHSHFWLFFKINAPAVLVTTIAVIAARDEVREISHHLPRGLGLVGHETEILEMSLLNFSAWILSWIAFCFVFGATCIAVEENAAGFTASAGRSFLNIRERLIPFLRVSLLLLIVVVAAEAASVVVALGVFWVFRHERVHTSTLVTNAVSYGLV